LLNLWLMEKREEQADQIFELRQHIEYAKKDIVDQSKRRSKYLYGMNELVKQREKEIDLMQHQLGREKDLLEAEQERNKKAHRAINELIYERRRLMGLVADYAGEMK